MTRKPVARCNQSAKPAAVAPSATSESAAEARQTGLRGAWRRTTLKERVEVVTALITATAALFAGAKYVFGLFSPIALELELPPAIEFRCSEYSQDASRACLQDGRTSSMTVTAALFLRASGDPTQEATVTHATAEVKPRWQSEAKQLTWFWSADFVTGQEIRRRQVTVQSIKGGEARSAEMWFFPLEEACPPGSTVQACKSTAETNFVAWGEFIGDLARDRDALLAEKAAIDLKFAFHYREGKEQKVKEVTCVVNVTPKARAAALVVDPINSERTQPVISITVPCRQPEKPAASWYEFWREIGWWRGAQPAGLVVHK